MKSTFLRVPAKDPKREFKVGDKIRVDLYHSKIEDAVVRAVIQEIAMLFAIFFLTLARRPGMSIAIESSDELEKLRHRLRKMSDDELMRFGKAARSL